MRPRSTSSSCASAAVNASSLRRAAPRGRRGRAGARASSAGSMRVSTIRCAVRGEMLEGVVDRCQAVVVRHGLQVVEHEHELAPERRDAVHELVDRTVERGSAGSAPSRRSAATAETLTHPIDRGRDVGPQPDRVVVTAHRASPTRAVRSGPRTTHAPQSSSRSRPAPPRASAPRPRRRRAPAGSAAARRSPPWPRRCELRLGERPHGAGVSRARTPRVRRRLASADLPRRGVLGLRAPA